MATSYYDYSQLWANGVTPSAVYAKGSPVYRLLANGVDIIHKRTGYTMNFRCGLHFDLTTSLENRYEDAGGYWNCGDYYPDYRYVGKYIFVRVRPVSGLARFLLESSGDGEARSLGGIYLFGISVAIYDNYGRRVDAYGGKITVSTSANDCWEFTTGIVSGFGRVDVAADLKWGDIRWTRKWVGQPYSLTASGSFTSSGTYKIWGAWQSRSETVQEY